MTDQPALAVLVPEETAALPGNEAIASILAMGASPRPESMDEPWAAGGFAVPSHPDLVARVRDAAQAADLPAAYLYGVPVVSTAAGVIVATAHGMREIRIRLPADQIAPALLADQAADPDLGAGWARLAAWPVEVPGGEIIPALAAVLRVAAEAAPRPRPRRRRGPGTDGAARAGGTTPQTRARRQTKRP